MQRECRHCRAGICLNLGLEFGPTLHYTQLNSAQQVLWEIFSDICYVTLAHKKKMQLCMGVYMIKISVHRYYGVSTLTIPNLKLVANNNGDGMEETSEPCH